MCSTYTSLDFECKQCILVQIRFTHLDIYNSGHCLNLLSKFAFFVFYLNSFSSQKNITTVGLLSIIGRENRELFTS